MRPRLIAEISKTVGDRLTPHEVDSVVDRVIRIVEDYNRTVALAAIETAKTAIVKESDAAVEPAVPSKRV